MRCAGEHRGELDEEKNPFVQCKVELGSTAASLRHILIDRLLVSTRVIIVISSPNVHTTTRAGWFTLACSLSLNPPSARLSSSIKIGEQKFACLHPKSPLCYIPWGSGYDLPGPNLPIWSCSCCWLLCVLMYIIYYITSSQLRIHL